MDSQKNNRIVWIDILKGITVFLVVIHHSILSVDTLLLEPTQNIWLLIKKANSLLSNARMPAFFLAGGIVMASLRGNKINWLFTKRIPVMLWIIVIWTCISLLYEELGMYLYPWVNRPIFPSGYVFPMPFGNLWFIYSILLLSIYTVAISNLRIIYQLIVTAILSLLIHYYLKHFEFDFRINKLLFTHLAYEGLPFFTFGFIFKQKIVNFLKNKKETSYLLILTALLSIFCFIFVPYPENYSLLFFRYIPLTFFFVGFIVLFSRLGIINNLFTYIGRYSLEFFLLHQFFIATFYALYPMELLKLNFIFNISFSIFLPIIVCLLFIKYFQRFMKPVFFSAPSFTRIG